MSYYELPRSAECQRCRECQHFWWRPGNGGGKYLYRVRYATGRDIIPWSGGQPADSMGTGPQFSMWVRVGGLP